VVPDSFYLRIEKLSADPFELPLLSLEEVFCDPLVPDNACVSRPVARSQRHGVRARGR
jgi:hypothetical protein